MAQARSQDARPSASPNGRILVVDDLEANVRLVSRLLRREGHDIVTAGNGEEAIEAVRRHSPDLVVMDVAMPRMDGFEACRRIKAQPSTRLVPIVLVTALEDRRHRLRGLEAGADDFITKPFNALELRARVRSLLRIKRYTDDLDSADSVIMSLALTIEARDPATDGHCQRLAAYGAMLGRALGLCCEDISALTRGGYLHDVGKVGIPDAVLLKPERLTAAEYAVMKQHTIIGDRLCGELQSLRRARPIVRHHHERLDGGGYPDGLRGDQIPLVAQIMGVVDVYDAITTARPYKPALPAEQALDELVGEAARGWRRRDLVDQFIDVVSADGLPAFQASGAEADTHA